MRLTTVIVVGSLGALVPFSLFAGFGANDAFGVQVIHNYTTNDYYLSRGAQNGTDVTLQKIPAGETVSVYAGAQIPQFWLGTDPALTASELTPWSLDGPTQGQVADLILVYDYTTGQDTFELVYNCMDSVHSINGVNPSDFFWPQVSGQDWGGVFVNGFSWGFGGMIPFIFVWAIRRGLKPSLPSD